ncbi:hypothetical protein K505DRAFT_361357 [Melanomma pulvis-pyrius CBS 109.77]|uniref:Aminoglycoside phosphotransferase domain-containing protein n=1 Tax=Melanomma pulvis-pyrius CBS 109.77 TaxID=1314802 RepID=A0A6A6XE19_9PLEO|nr:hypothetical protein K505DRAFT_361357 [Melanomma pulvis-pyrius CBS 109.77]
MHGHEQCQLCSRDREDFWTALEEDLLLSEGTGSRAQLDNSTRDVMEAILRSDPFDASIGPQDEKGTFVLRHDNLTISTSNIFCNPHTGEVTAIIDWDNARAVPRFYGYASLPDFLKLD